MNERNGKSFCEALHEKFSSQLDFENLDNIIVRGISFIISVVIFFIQLGFTRLSYKENEYFSSFLRSGSLRILPIDCHSIATQVN